MAAFYKYCLPCIVAATTLLPARAFSQFRGGNDDGHSVALATNQPMGRNIFRGGNDDGTDVFLASNQPMGRIIFKGGNDDGVNVFISSNQPLGRNIFKGGDDDGTDMFLSSNQPLGRNIFKGGNDDGVDVFLSSNQPLGRNIFKGGVDDGWAMAFKTGAQLPVTLTDFSGRWQENNGLLSWKTTTEINTAYFELERSFDGRSYNKIQQVTAAGNSTTNQNYQYADIDIKKLAPAGVTTLYYRLRSVDKDGAATYSGVVLLKLTGISSNVEYAVFPNPATSFITITASGLPAVEGTYIRLADVSGKVLMLQKLTASRQQVAVSAYPSGIYFLQLVTTDKVVYTQKIIIRK